MKTTDKIERLVEVFDRNLEAYKSSGYKEANVRSEFIDPFFEALGWDVYNKQGYAEAYKDVITEDAIKVGGATKAPDYCFRIGGARKFFVEAKKPSVDIKGDVNPAYQLRRYAWSAGLPLSILTDFEEFAVYDCRLRPSLKDKSGHGRVLYLTYHDYLEKWEEIAAVFSKQAVLEGRFDKYVESKKKRATQEVDTEFLKEIEEWRDLLARNLALRNPDLGIRELNFAVQKTIDRIIFLRICEDRGIETYGRLQALINGKDLYPRLKKIFLQADDKYNSGLFHFRREKDEATPPDELTLDLKIDDKVLKEIFKRLYYPESPYEFSVLGAEILGHIYEQFLGKVIKLTKGHQAKVEEKPEVRKAGGVYYTPTYIVDYIVRNTVGKLCEKKTPKKIEKLRILDPACGSGSFLIGAYSYLIDYHRDWYLENLIPARTARGHISKATLRKHVPGPNPEVPIYQGKGGQWYLTTREKKRILLNNIYGVDIDSQAVEVTKLSLLLKVLENENQDSLERQMKLWRERALPDLGNNIKCGNSLIGPDFYDNQQLTLLEDEEQTRVNAFDWPTEFPEIMQSGGFDAVIGNPPYIFTRNQGISESEKAYFNQHYKQQSKQLNTFGIFIEQSHMLLHKMGLLGFIMPNNWLTISSFVPLRKFLLEKTSKIKIINILDRVFASAHVDCAILLFCKNIPNDLTISEMKDKVEIFSNKVPISLISPPEYIIQISLLKEPNMQRLLKKIEHISHPLSTFAVVSTGLKAYQTGKGKPPQTNRQKEERVFHANSKLSATFFPYLKGIDVCRYYIMWSGEYLNYGDWLAEPRRSVPFDGERILVRQIPSRPPYLILGAFSDEPFYNDINSMVIFNPTSGISLKYILGIINSKLISLWFLRRYDKLQRKIFPQFKVNELAAFPIRKINFSDDTEKTHYDKLVKMVERIMELQIRIQHTKTPIDKTKLERRIKATDNQIDQLVYELYGLTEKEIQIVEESI